jgi:hypothetical protein
MITSYRKAVRPFVAGALLWLGVADAMAVERKFETRIGIVTVDVDADWRIVNAEPEDASGISFELGRGGQTMQFFLGTTNEPGNQEISPAAARKLVEDVRTDEIAEGFKADEVSAFTGSQFSGYYFRETGVPRPTPRPGEYTWQIVGVLVTPSAPLLFTIAWNDGGKAAADRAFAAVKQLKLSKR